MKERTLFGATFFLLLVVCGCAKPDRVTTVKAPLEGVFYTVETWEGHGAMSDDFTRVYAHLKNNGKSDRILVLDGEYLEVSKIVWDTTHDVTLCMQQGGITGTFRSEVTLRAGGVSQNIYNHLQENCAPASK